MSGRVVTFGEAVGVMSAVGFGGLEHQTALALGTGGAEANVAIGLSRLGLAVTWIGCVGEDSIGRRAVRELRAEGVHVLARTVPEAATGLLIKERPTTGTARITHHRRHSAGSRLTPDDLEPARLVGADLMHLTGITPALSLTAHDAALHAVRLAGELGIPVSFDVNHRAKLWAGRNPATVYRDLAAEASVVFAGLDEAQIMLGRDELTAEDAAREIAELGPREVVIKLGSGGALSSVDGQVRSVPAVPVDVVDTVGAGDAFVAGYLAARFEAAPPQERLRLGATAGAAVCCVSGDWEGAVRRTEIDAFLAAGDPVDR